MDYKEKLRLAKEALESGSYDKDTIEYIFPELKENEDEKIRKALIRFHKSSIDIDGIKGYDILAWLEKQGEQKPTETTDLRTWKYIVDAVLTEREGIGQYIDSPWTTEVAKKLQKRFGSIEQNRAWSEEDIRNIQDIDSVLFYDKDLPEETCIRLRNWLKSLRPQPKQEWSKEDERILDALVTSLNNEHFTGRLETLKGIGVSLVIDWLKSLKDRIKDC